MLNNGSSDSNDSEIEAICRRTRGRDNIFTIESEKKKKKTDAGDTSDGSQAIDESENPISDDENENEMVLVPTGELVQIQSIDAIRCDGKVRNWIWYHLVHF